MTSFIDPSVPIFGSPTTESVRHNFLIAKQEIEALQTAVGLTVPVSVASGGTGANNAHDALENLNALPLSGGTLTGLLVLSGNPTDVRGATTKQYVDAFFPVSILNGGTGANNPTMALSNLGGAPLVSPVFTGIPSAPTQPPGTSSTILATTEFVHDAIGGLSFGVMSITAGPGLTGGGTGAVTIGLNTPLSVAYGGTGSTTAGGALNNLGAAPIVSPGFLGTPTAPTSVAGNNSNAVATTAFVTGAVADAIASTTGGVTSITAGVGLGGGGTGAVSLYLVTPVPIVDGGTGSNFAAGALSNLGGAPLMSPAFTGAPTAPTPGGTDNSTAVATTAWVRGFISGGSGALSGLSDVQITGLAANDVLMYDSGTSKWLNRRPRYNISSYVPGVLTTLQTLLYHKFAKAVTFNANWAAYVGQAGEAGAGVVATGSTVLTIERALAASPTTFSGVGTVTFGAGSANGTLASTGPVGFAQGDVLRVRGPGTADATLADLFLTLVGYET